MSALISKPDESMLRHMTNLKVGLGVGGGVGGWLCGEGRWWGEVMCSFLRGGRVSWNKISHFCPTVPRQVEEHKFPRECRKVLLFFGKNSYFQNEVVTKEYVLGLAGKCPLTAWAAVGGGLNVISSLAPSHILVFLQGIGRLIPVPSSGTQGTDRRPTDAGMTTAASTSSTGSLATALPALAGLLRWGPVTRKGGDFHGFPHCVG